MTSSLHDQRRRFLAFFAGTGMGATLMPGALWAQAQASQSGTITLDMVKAAEQVIGMTFTDAQREMMLDGLNQNHDRIVSLRRIEVANSVDSCLRFSPVVPGMHFDMTRQPLRLSKAPVVRRPPNLEDVAFWPVTHLAALLRTRQVTSTELTRMYIARLKRYDPVLKCVITLTEDLALEQAAAADAQIAAGHYKGPLHGIPWGAKDLISRKHVPTTWGAAPYKDQVFDHDATLVERLDAAGSVLIAKLSSGELAGGDTWFGGQTKNPWNPAEGSSGSSAGPASATAAGCVGFAIGSETTGSIVGPSTRCSVYGMRPTFGRISRHGVMTLAWSMDKLGPLCRSVEDIAIVFDAIRGPDGHDLTVVDMPFNYDANLDIRTLRVGYVKAAFDEARPVQEEKDNDAAALARLESMGVKLIPISYPDFPINDIVDIMDTEFAAAFDPLTRSGRDALLAHQEKSSDANLDRTNRFMPAVEYLRTTQLRTLLMQAMAQTMKDIDVYVAPITSSRRPSSPSGPPPGGAPAAPRRSLIGINTALTNLTGHPGVVVRNGINARGQPTSFSFVGQIYGEARMLALAHAYQSATRWHEAHPPLDFA